MPSCNIFLPNPGGYYNKHGGVSLYPIVFTPNASGAHYHQIFLFLTTVNFLQIEKFLVGIFKPVSRRIYFGFIVSATTFIDAPNGRF